MAIRSNITSTSLAVEQLAVVECKGEGGAAEGGYLTLANSQYRELLEAGMMLDAYLLQLLELGDGVTLGQVVGVEGEGALAALEGLLAR